MNMIHMQAREKKLLRFNVEVAEFKRVITENIENLFVVAAGNGYKIGRNDDFRRAPC